MAQDEQDKDDGSLQTRIARADRMLEIALCNYEDVIGDLHDMKSEMRGAGKMNEAELKRFVSMVSRTIETVYKEKDRLDDFRKKLGKGGTTDLDFDALRAEIGRRLDKLRAARAAGSVSGGSE